MMWDDNGYGGGWRMMDGNGTFGLVLMLILVALLVAGTVVLLVTTRRISQLPPRPTSAGGAAGPDEGLADRILDERLARGEIDEDEYTRRRAALHDH